MPKTNRLKFRRLCLTREDERALSDALLEKFPDMRFLADVPVGCNHSFIPPGVTEPSKEHMTYVADFADMGFRNRFYAWREPADWTPIWMGPDEFGYYPLANMPRHFLMYMRGGPFDLTLDDGRKVGSFSLGYFGSNYLVFDEEQKRFLGQVWRILGKLVTNVVITIDHKTGKAMGPPEKAYMFWAGYHALEWCRQSDDRFLDGDVRPADEYEKWK